MTVESQRIERIIQKHVHDVRNSINSLDLEAVLLGETITDPEVLGTLRRMRAELTQMEAMVQTLHYKFAEPVPLTLTTGDLLYLWQRQIAPLETVARRISWSPPPPMAREVTLDAHAIVSIMREIVLAAWGRAPACVLKAAVTTTEQSVGMELREPIPRTPPAADELMEHQGLVAIHGGTLTAGEDALTGERVISLDFAVLHAKAAE